MALPKSHSQSVLPNPRLLVLETIEQFEDRFLLTVRVQQVPLCPECGRASESRHSHYVRRLQDLPGQGLSVQIHLRVRRFRCRNPDCQRRVFTERVEGVPPYLRQTSRLAEIVRLVGYVAGGLPGARLLARLAILTSDDTVLRRVKVPSSATLSSNPPDVLGVDDWAWRKGHTYGTILVDLEQHCVVDLLPCRSAESFEAWLRGICVLNRGWQCYQRVDYDRGDCTPTSVPQRPFLVAAIGFATSERYQELAVCEDPLATLLSDTLEKYLHQARHQPRIHTKALLAYQRAADLFEEIAKRPFGPCWPVYLKWRNHFDDIWLPQDLFWNDSSKK